MEASHHASDLDPSSVLGFGSALALLDTADEAGRLLTGALRSMGLSDLQAVVLGDALEEGPAVVGSVGTKPLPEAVVCELRRLAADVSMAASNGGPGVARRTRDVDADAHPALAEQGLHRLSLLRLGTVDHDFGLVVAGRAEDTRPSPMQASVLQMLAAQVSMALHRIQLDRQRRSKEEALRASEARYRELYENAPVAYMSVDGEGAIHMANERAAALLRTDRDALLGTTIPDVCADTAEAAETVRRLTECIRGRERLYDQEVEICRADGERIWVSMSVQPVDPPDGPPECLVMMADITDRVEMAAALRSARDELETRVEARTEELRAANEQLRRQAKRLEALRDVDRAILAAGSPREIATVAARRAQDLVPCERVSVALFDWAEEQVTVLAAQQQEDETLLERGATFPVEAFTLSDRLRAGEIDDMPHFGEARSTPLTDRLWEAGIRSALTVPMLVEDQLIGTLNLGATEPAAFSDTERRIGRELADHLAIALRQSRLLETVQGKREQLAALRDVDQAILAAESPEEIAAAVLQRARRILPFESASVAATDWAAGVVRVLATSESNVLDSPRTLPLDEVYLSDRVRAGKTEVASVEDYAAVPAAQARMREMGLKSILCLPMVVEGDVVGVVHVGRTAPDAFTETDWQVGRELADHMAIALRQAQLLEEVQERREQLEERVQERTAELESFTYSVSHDLRTPLRAVDGYARILKEEYADQLDEEGRRLLDVVHDSAQTMGDQIDDLLTLSRVGRREMTRVVVDLEALAREVFDELRRTHPRADEVAFRLRSLPPARGDRSMLRHVFSNLLSNALKFTQREEAPRIEVGATERDGAPAYYVRDNGVGFDAERAEEVFGVFQRLHDDSDFEGTGVGLALVERVVRRHDGTVWAEGAEGAGATIFFTLPRPDRG
jgi:PAS domain S-box-containing protein